jgi:hypothetical protein
MAKAMKVKAGTSYALVANMAVLPEWRGQGLARNLLAACEAVTLLRFRPRPAGLLLLVHRDNTAAISLYTSMGYEQTEWMDPQVGSRGSLAFSGAGEEGRHPALLDLGLAGQVLVDWSTARGGGGRKAETPSIPQAGAMLEGRPAAHLN